MAYPLELKNEAFELYCSGLSALKIAEEMKARHPKACAKLSEKTVLSWINDPGAFGETWADKKARVQARAIDKTGEKAADKMSQLHGVLDDLVGSLRERFQAVAGHPSQNPDYTAQVLLQALSKSVELIRIPAVGNITDAGQVELFIQVLQEDPELGEVFVRRRQALQKAYREKLEEVRN